MIVKVCGLRNAQNIEDICKLGVDMLGFILYPPSPRYVGESVLPETKEQARVGVFVNEKMDNIIHQAQRIQLTHLQLHGNENVEECESLRSKGYKVIKSISVENADDVRKAQLYDGKVDILLFDTKCSEHGGSGKSFDWSLLNKYQGSTPFLLSGGITLQMADEINAINHPKFMGIDINSRFEIEPALKDINKIEKFLKNIKR